MKQVEAKLSLDQMEKASANHKYLVMNGNMKKTFAKPQTKFVSIKVVAALRRRSIIVFMVAITAFTFCCC